MALGVVEALGGVTWPDGDPMLVRVGVASGPAVAGVIGREKFAYDLWGDTVNLASRLESSGLPGKILVCDETVRLLASRYRLDAPMWLDVKGRGRTRAHILAGRL